MNPTRAPFPWFGGKSRCAHLVWQRFGDIPNYVEPFFGSGAVLLGRPTPARTETVNDMDCYLANFWRAVQADPEQVALQADWPVNEADLHARHIWLTNQTTFRSRMREDPEYYDARIAGWWVWGISQWIGSGWCSRPELVGRTLPGRAARGIQSDKFNQRPNLTKRGGVGSGRNKNDHLTPAVSPNGGEGEGSVRVRDISMSDTWKKRPNLHRGGRGVHSRMGQWKTRPFLSNANGQGVQALNKMSLSRQMPQLGGLGSGAQRGVLRNQISSSSICHPALPCTRRGSFQKEPQWSQVVMCGPPVSELRSPRGLRVSPPF